MKMWYHNQTWRATAATPSDCFLIFSGRVNSAVSYVDPDLKIQAWSFVERAVQETDRSCLYKVRHNIRMSVSSYLVRTGAVYDFCSRSSVVVTMLQSASAVH